MLNVVSDYKELIPSMGNIVNLIYPVGSYYISETANNPIEALLNEYGIENSWVKVERFLYGGLPEGKELGDEGGEMNHTLTSSEMPSHAHEKGTMDITGHMGGLGYRDTFTGAFKFITNYSGTSDVDSNDSGGWGWRSSVDFNAANSWTGETSSVGGNAAHNNMPPYRCVNIWRRET